MDELLRKSALDYHRLPTPGKISVVPTKALLNQRDLALAYSPGVAAACEEIVRDPTTARSYTARGNLVGQPPVKDDYKTMTACFVYLGDRVLVSATIFSDDPKGPAYGEAVRLLKSLAVSWPSEAI